MLSVHGEFKQEVLTTAINPTDFNRLGCPFDLSTDNNLPTNNTMGFLETTFTLTHSVPIPCSGVSKAAAVEKMHDHVFFIQSGPYAVSYALQPEPSWSSYDKPKGITPVADKVEVYEVKNKYENPIVGSDIKSTYEFIDVADGIWIRVRSPMGTVMESTYRFRDKSDGTLEFVHETQARCSKALAGIAKKDAEKSYTMVTEVIAKSLGES